MNRILLADDSPHAQRMGERILRDEGYEIVSVTDGQTALLRLADVDPDLIVADAFLPGRSGLDICRWVKSQPQHRHVRVVLTAGLLETFDEKEAEAAGADAVIRKPFESSLVLETIKPLVSAAEAARSSVAAEVTPTPAPEPAPEPEPPMPAPAPDEPVPVQSSYAEIPPAPSGTGVSEEELLRAAVTLALDSAFPSLVETITANVLRNLRDAGTKTAPAIETSSLTLNN